MMGLISPLQYFRKNGIDGDWDNQGIPTVSAVRRLTGKVLHRDEIKERWIALYRDERGRDPDS